MKITITIDDRTGNAIKEFCKANNVKQNDYLAGIIEKQFNVDRFGDLNELIQKRNNKKVEMKRVVGTERQEKCDSSNEVITTKQKAEESPKEKHSKRTLAVK